jgi:predicted amidohydrolase
MHRDATLAKVEDAVREAADGGAQLAVFGEALVPGYPFWVDLTGGARFGDPDQARYFARYLEEGVDVAAGDLAGVQRLCAERGVAVYLGVMERAADRAGHSLYASLVYIAPDGEVGSVHRKLCPTHEERLVWAPGDGNGLRVHELGGFTLGGLNCWENWMPLPRAALYAQGETLHVAVWPGSTRNTHDITRFVAKEGRSYVVSVSALMRRDAFPEDTPLREQIVAAAPEVLADGGSCVCGPDGEWIVEPMPTEEAVTFADLDPARVREARHLFDPSGHYSRPDVTRLEVDRQRLRIAHFSDEA